jgi:aldose 1-epimerase
VPDRHGAIANVVLGAPSLEAQLAGFPSGSIVGRVANRIAGARFTLDGEEFRLAANEGRHHLHGGERGFQHATWAAQIADGPAGPAVTLTHVSPEGDEGYPGRLEVAARYTLSPRGLDLTCRAITTRATPVNLTNHAYWNLAGEGTVLEHELWLDAPAYTPVDADLIPTGAIESVRGTPLDFTRRERIGRRIAALEVPAGGYDHNLVLEPGRSPGSVCARLQDPASGRRLDLITREPGLQLYTANRLRPVESVGGIVFGRHGGVCLETQHFPDSVHHPAFPSVILQPGDVYSTSTSFRLFAI